MTEAGEATITSPRLTVRQLARRDRPRLLALARQTQSLPWPPEELADVVGSPDSIGCLVEMRGGIVGLVIGATEHGHEPSPHPSFDRLVRLICRWVGWSCPLLKLDRLSIWVAPDRPRDEIERALLRRFVWDLCMAADRVHVVVPESGLVTQLCLRDAGFRATRVVRGHYGSEDGYLMVRRSSTTGVVRRGPLRAAESLVRW